MADEGGRRGFRWTPAAIVIAVAAIVATGLRAYQLSRPGFLLGATEYDDGPYFGSAVRLISGVLPYKSFVVVQPPGITLLMVPAAAVGKISGSAAAGMAIGRILTAAASVAAVVLAGLWVRHRGMLAVLVTCGVLAVYPDAVGAAHTVLVEPWLVLFTLAGLITVFDRDQVTPRARRLGWGGVLLGVAGLVEGWAIVPVLVLLAVIAATTGAQRWRRAGWVAGGVAAGFIIPVAPFLAASPHGVYRSLITAQIGRRAHAVRVGAVDRLRDMAGLTDFQLPSTGAVVFISVVIAVAIVGFTVAAWILARKPPPPLDAFAVVATAAVIGMLWWPNQFHYHFSAFLAPFLAAAIGLSAARWAGALAAARPAAAPWLRWGTSGLAAGLLIWFSVLHFGTESRLGPYISPAEISSVTRTIPRGACVVSDEASYLLMANRFSSDVPGCSQMIDGLGTDLALSGGLKPETGAGRHPAVAAAWRSAFRHAGYALLTISQYKRIPYTHGLRQYFRSNFAEAAHDARGDALYVRTPASHG
jgi:hypothetical protein